MGGEAVGAKALWAGAGRCLCSQAAERGSSCRGLQRGRQRPAWTWVTSKNNGKKPLNVSSGGRPDQISSLQRSLWLLCEELMETALQEKQEEKEVRGALVVQA